MVWWGVFTYLFIYLFMFTSFKLTIKVPPTSVADWKISATSSTAYLGICSIHVVEYGWGIPCMDTEKVNENAMYTEWPTDPTMNQAAELVILKLTNVGQLL